MGSDRAKLCIALGGGIGRGAFRMRTLRFLNVGSQPAPQAGCAGQRSPQPTRESPAEAGGRPAIRSGPPCARVVPPVCPRVSDVVGAQGFEPWTR